MTNLEKAIKKQEAYIAMLERTIQGYLKNNTPRSGRVVTLNMLMTERLRLRELSHK